METLPDEPPGLSLDDRELVQELDRRSQILDGLVPADKLWEQE